jgi:pimeloyl-ACP methyl ester carboxylesterase
MRWLLLLLALAACAPRLELPTVPRGLEPRLPGLVEASRWSWQGQRLHSEAGGQGRPVLLLHDLEPGADAFTAWRRNTVALLEAGFRVVALDLPGFGRSTRFDRRMTPEDVLAPLEAFMESLEEPVAVLAAGRSAALVIDLAARRPELVAKMVLVAPRGYEPAPAEEEIVVRYRALQGGGLFSPDPFRARASLSGILAYLQETAYSNPDYLDLDIVATYLANLQVPGSKASFYSAESGSLDRSIKARWPETAQPALLIWGAEDRRVPVSGAERFLLARPDAELRVLAGAKGAVAEERGFAFNAFMVEFLLRAGKGGE